MRRSEPSCGCWRGLPSDLGEVWTPLEDAVAEEVFATRRQGLGAATRSLDGVFNSRRWRWTSRALNAVH